MVWSVLTRACSICAACSSPEIKILPPDKIGSFARSNPHRLLAPKSTSGPFSHKLFSHVKLNRHLLQRSTYSEILFSKINLDKERILLIGHACVKPKTEYTHPLPLNLSWDEVLLCQVATCMVLVLVLVLVLALVGPTLGMTLMLLPPYIPRWCK